MSILYGVDCCNVFMYIIYVDEIVGEVKRQAMLEVRQAVTAAEMKANDLVQQERLKMEQSIEQIKQLAKDEAMKALSSQSESQEVCSPSLT